MDKMMRPFKITVAQLVGHASVLPSTENGEYIAEISMINEIMMLRAIGIQATRPIPDATPNRSLPGNVILRSIPADSTRPGDAASKAPALRRRPTACRTPAHRTLILFENFLDMQD
jgi:hypothetical protein